MKIKSITTVYQQRPTIHFVWSREYFKNATVNEQPNICKNIAIETRRVSSDKEINYCVGYNHFNKIIFEYPQDSVSIEYFAIDPENY